MIVRALGAAVAFLTRVPWLARFQYTGVDLVRGAPAFPLVGAAIGALVGGAVVAGTGLGLPALLAATLAIGLEVILTGALHLDGLADSADGLAGRTPERTLQIMRDPGVGVYGTAAVALDLLVKVVAVGSLPRADVVPVLIAVYAVSRTAPLPLAAALPYAGNGRDRESVRRRCRLGPHRCRRRCCGGGGRRGGRRMGGSAAGEPGRGDRCGRGRHAAGD